MLFPVTLKHVCWWHVRSAASSYSRTVVQSVALAVIAVPEQRPGRAPLPGAWCLYNMFARSSLSLFIAVIIKVALHCIDR